MQKFNIRFNGIKDKALFVDVANKKDYDIDLTYGNTQADGKSCLSVISMPDEVHIRAEFNTESDDVEKDFELWIVK